MKKGYVKPTIEIEEFTINTAIAAGCASIISFGPGVYGYETCKEYIQEFSLARTANNFYEKNCNCYVNASGGALMTS